MNSSTDRYRGRDRYIAQTVTQNAVLAVSDTDRVPNERFGNPQIRERLVRQTMRVYPGDSSRCQQAQSLRD